MSAIDSLLQTQRWAIRERRQALTDLAGMAERLRQDIRTLEGQLADSARSLDDGGGEAQGSDPYRAELEARCGRLQATLKDIEQEASSLEEELQQALRAMEDVEQANRNRTAAGGGSPKSRDASIRDRLATSLYQTRARRST